MTPLLVESWIWWSVVMLVALSRFISRRMALGTIRKFQSDDYLMVVVLCFYTTLISTINIVRNSSSNLLPPGFNVQRLTKQEIHQREYGSKLILVVEQCQCVTIWGVKGCLILLYLRLTSIHRENVAIKILGAYVVITFVVMDILYFAVWCRPFHEYWAVPTNSRQCDAATNHLITNAVFNLTSDVAMLLIVLPIFLRMKLAWKKKIPVILLFSLGLFTILAAILNKVYSFSEPYGSLWTYWYTRESSTALLVANLPFVWTLWRKIPGVRTVIWASQSQAQRYGSGNGLAAKVPVTDGKREFPNERNDFDHLGGSGELEMVEGVPDEEPGSMTLAEMLGEENPASMSEKEPTPITHPQLFYSRKKSVVQENLDAKIDAAVLVDTAERDTVRRHSNLNPRSGDAIESSAYPSTTSKKSTDSFI